MTTISLSKFEDKHNFIYKVITDINELKNNVSDIVHRIQTNLSNYKNDIENIIEKIKKKFNKENKQVPFDIFLIYNNIISTYDKQIISQDNNADIIYFQPLKDILERGIMRACFIEEKIELDEYIINDINNYIKNIISIEKFYREYFLELKYKIELLKNKHIEIIENFQIYL